eukprot:933434-Pelagomonas_calceolata.AAC.7
MDGTPRHEGVSLCSCSFQERIMYYAVVHACSRQLQPAPLRISSVYGDCGVAALCIQECNFSPGLLHPPAPHQRQAEAVHLQQLMGSAVTSASTPPVQIACPDAPIE